MLNRKELVEVEDKKGAMADFKTDFEKEWNSVEEKKNELACNRSNDTINVLEDKKSPAKIHSDCWS